MDIEKAGDQFLDNMVHQFEPIPDDGKVHVRFSRREVGDFMFGAMSFLHGHAPDGQIEREVLKLHMNLWCGDSFSIFNDALAETYLAGLRFKPPWQGES